MVHSGLVVLLRYQAGWWFTATQQTSLVHQQCIARQAAHPIECHVLELRIIRRGGIMELQGSLPGGLPTMVRLQPPPSAFCPMGAQALAETSRK